MFQTVWVMGIHCWVKQIWGKKVPHGHVIRDLDTCFLCWPFVYCSTSYVKPHCWTEWVKEDRHLADKCFFIKVELLQNKRWRKASFLWLHGTNHGTCALMMLQVPWWTGRVSWTDRVWISLHCLQTQRDHVSCFNKASLHWGRRSAGTRPSLRICWGNAFGPRPFMPDFQIKIVFDD